MTGKIFFLNVSIYFIPLFAAAQKVDFRFYTVADGLPQNAVYSIAQYSQDFIWANAELHFTSFEGVRFLSFQFQASHFLQRPGHFQQMQVDGELLVYCNPRLIFVAPIALTLIVLKPRLLFPR